MTKHYHNLSVSVVFEGIQTCSTANDEVHCKHLILHSFITLL